MSNVAYINHDELTALIKSDAVAGKDYQVVDVRGECKKVIDIRNSLIAISLPHRRRLSRRKHVGLALSPSAYED